MKQLMLAFMAAALIAAALACGDDEKNPTGPVSTVDTVTSPFTIRFGRTVYVEPYDLTVTFDSLYDNRCSRCYWLGVARIRLEVVTPQGDRHGVVMIRYGGPGRPDSTVVLYTDSAKYTFTLGDLMSTDTTGWPHHYRAEISVAPYDAPDPVVGPVVRTRMPIPELGSDPFDVDSAWIDGSLLHVKFAYGGGCKEHNFWVYMVPEAFGDLGTPLTRLFPSHYANDDFCRAYVHEELVFDLQPVIDRYYEIFGDYGDFIIDLYEMPRGTYELKTSLHYQP